MWIEISGFRARAVAFRNLRGPSKAGNFLRCWETNDFLRRAALFGVTEDAEFSDASVLKMVIEGL
jgi:hypothetical protein